MADIQPLEFGENLRPSTVGAMNKINELVNAVNNTKRIYFTTELNDLDSVKHPNFSYATYNDESITLEELINLMHPTIKQYTSSRKILVLENPVPFLIALCPWENPWGTFYILNLDTTECSVQNGEIKSFKITYRRSQLTTTSSVASLYSYRYTLNFENGEYFVTGETNKRNIDSWG